MLRRTTRTRPRTWTESAGRARTRFSGSRLVHGQWPAFERLVIELLDGGLGLCGISKLNESKSALLSRLTVQRNRNVRQVADSREVIPDFILRCLVRKISDKKADAHLYLFQPLIIRFRCGELSQR